MSFDLFSNASADVQSQEFTSSGTFAVPAGVRLVWVSGVGGGAGGGGAGDASSTYDYGGSGGGSGEHAFRHPIHVTPAASVSVTIGSGGAGGAAVGIVGGDSGSDGGDSEFGTSLRLRGGVGGGGGFTTTSADANPRPGRGGGVGGALGADQRDSFIQGGGIPWRQIRSIGTISGGACGGRTFRTDPSNGGDFADNTGGTTTDYEFGAGGGASFYGNGGNGGASAGSAGSAGQGYGAGGGGGAAPGSGTGAGGDGGDGVDGYLKVEWFE